MGYTKEQRIINSVTGTSKGKKSTNEKSKGKGFVLPNNSGDHVRSIKREAPINNYDLVNKEYVDDNFINTSGDTMTGTLRMQHFLVMDNTLPLPGTTHQIGFGYGDNSIASLFGEHTDDGDFLFMTGGDGLDIGDGGWLGRRWSQVGKIYLQSSGVLTDGTNEVTVEELKEAVDLSKATTQGGDVTTFEGNILTYG